MFILSYLYSGLPEEIITNFKHGFPNDWKELVFEHLLNKSRKKLVQKKNENRKSHRDSATKSHRKVETDSSQSNKKNLAASDMNVFNSSVDNVKMLKKKKQTLREPTNTLNMSAPVVSSKPKKLSKWLGFTFM